MTSAPSEHEHGCGTKHHSTRNPRAQARRSSRHDAGGAGRRHAPRGRRHDASRRRRGCVSADGAGAAGHGQAGAALDLGEAGAGDARLVGVVDDDAAVAKEGADALQRRRVQVDVRRLPLAHVRGDGAVLAAEVAHLARRRRRLVARRRLAADVGVQVRQRRRAVAVGHGRHVEVVGCGAGQQWTRLQLWKMGLTYAEQRQSWAGC